MEKSKRITKKRLIALIAASLVPLAVITIGFFALAGRLLLTPTVLITFFLLPILALAGLFFLILSSKKPTVKAVISILLLVALLFCFCVLFLIGGYRTLDAYENDAAAKPYQEGIRYLYPNMPALEGLGNYTDITYYEYDARDYIFIWESRTLICRYSEADYPLEKARLEESYVFQETPMGEEDHICQPAVQLGDYHFRFLSVAYEDYQIWFPKTVMLIATNDKTREIAYLGLYDVDLDYIESLEEYINDSFGWKYIR